MKFLCFKLLIFIQCCVLYIVLVIISFALRGIRSVMDSKYYTQALTVHIVRESSEFLFCLHTETLPLCVSPICSTTLICYFMLHIN